MALVYLAATWAIGLVNSQITIDVFRLPHSIDWDLYVEAGRRAGTEELYVWPGGYQWCEHCVFRYSPVFAWLIAAISPIGIVGWRLLHLAVLPLMGWRLALVAVLSWPFWQDFQTGNLLTFAVVAGVLTMRGSAIGAASYVVIALLTPRPFLLPLLLWLLWVRPAWRFPVIGLALAQLAVVAVLGFADDWLLAMTQPNLDFGAFYDYGPARLLGAAWVLLGVPLALWLTSRGRVGLASLAAQPYWLGYYLMMPMVDLADPDRSPRGRLPDR